MITIQCDKCKKSLDKCEDAIWQVNQIGGYFSKLESCRVKIELCDDCMIEVIGQVEVTIK